MKLLKRLSTIGKKGTTTSRTRTDSGTAREAIGQQATRVRPSAESGLRVLLCTDHLPPSDGGVEQVVGNLAHRLSAQAHEVGVFALRSPDESVELDSHPDIEVFCSGKIDLTDYVGLQSTISLSALRDFGRVVKAFDPDLLHVHNRFFYTSYLGMLYTRRTDLPLVTSLHLGDLEYIDGLGGVAASTFQSVLSRRLVRASDAVICVSRAVEEVATSLGAQNATTLHNAVDPNQFDVDPSEFDKTLLYIGRMVRNNGPRDLVEAVPGILSKHPEAIIHFVGTGKLRPALEDLTEEFSVDDSVTFHGFVDDILSMYQLADVFCRPSYTEGLPLTLLEAMATYSVPVVTPVAGTAEVLSDGETGYFVDVGDPDGIAEVVNGLFDRPEELKRTAETGRRHVERQYSWEQRTEDIVQVYDDVLGSA